MTVTEGRGRDRGQGTRAGGGLRCEVIVPVHALRRVTSLLGISLMLVLVASAADAVVWTYQSQQQLWLDESEAAREPARQPLHWHAHAPAALLIAGEDEEAPPRALCIPDRARAHRAEHAWPGAGPR